jgi:hypothetical protein
MGARRKTRAGGSDSGPTGNDSGTGPAPPASPSVSASESQKEDESPAPGLIKFGGEASDQKYLDLLLADLGSAEEEGSPEFEILKTFRRKIAGLRRLPRHQRAQAIRVALEWLSAMMNTLREKRAYARHSRRTFRQLPAPK